MTSQPLQGRSAIITGASQGLGLAIARTFVANGANIVICARNQQAIAEARQELLASSARRGEVVALEADVSREHDVQRVVDAAIKAFGRVQILVNNAGVYGPMGSIDQVDWQEWVRSIEINLYGSVLPIRAILPHFREHRYGKVIQLSGGGATQPLPRITAYAAAKAAVVRLTESVALDVKDAGIDVNSIAPGALVTRMMNDLITAGPEAVGQRFFDRMRKVADDGGTPLERGAELAVFLASAASDGITGRLLSAPWDPWESLPDHRADLEAADSSDIYTLRRIVPKDRGKTWGDR
jgi:NAD(P)-dependent dehydrogenase (short-subunit alcohol dehydrogenase family)